MQHLSTTASFITISCLASIGYYWLVYHENPRIFHNSEFSSNFHVQFHQTIFDVFSANKKLRDLDDWKRPAGPPRVAIQIGHWNATEAPDELENLRVNTGTASHGYTEWETSLNIAEKTKVILEQNGITVELLPTTIPENYWADVFISLHADGNEDTTVSGYKITSPRKDYSGYADSLAAKIDVSYAKETGLPKDQTITPSMREYYAFNWRKYSHAIHPLTVATILETGFLTNSSDRTVIVKQPEKATRGIAEGILTYLDEHQELLQ